MIRLLTMTHGILALGAFMMAACLDESAFGGGHPGLRVALCQTEIVDGDVAENILRSEKAIREAAKRGADLACLPEAADWGWLYEHARRDAFQIPGKYTDGLSKIAAELKIWVCAGCLEKDGDKTFNSAVLIDRAGKIVLKHRKLETLMFLTEKLYQSGDPGDVKTVDTEFGRVGVTICADNFDRKNPKKAAELGAWLLVAPHGFAASQENLKKNAGEFQDHIRGVAKDARLWVVGTNTCRGPVKAGAWQGWPHSGCSTLARPDGSAAVVAKFNTPDLVVFDIPADAGQKGYVGDRFTGRDLSESPAVR
ncbi:MAG: carbon-nitrogen hydrolase family protein [Pirellulales bacterium]